MVDALQWIVDDAKAVGGWCLFVPTAAPYPDAAFEFIRWRPFQDVLVAAKHNTFLP